MTKSKTLPTDNQLSLDLGSCKGESSSKAKSTSTRQPKVIHLNINNTRSEIYKGILNRKMH